MADPSHEFSYTFDRAFIRKGLRRDWVWRGWLIVGLYVAAGVLITLVSERRVAAGVGFAVGLPFVWWVCARAFRQLIDRTFQMWSLQAPDHTMRFRLDDDGFEVDLSKGHVRYSWSDLRRLWRYPDVWALEIIKMQSVLFPPDAASDEAKAFIVERCRAAGVRV